MAKSKLFFVFLLSSVLCAASVRTSLAQDYTLLRDKLRELEGVISRQNKVQVDLKERLEKTQKENSILSQALEERLKERDSLKEEIRKLKEDFVVGQLGSLATLEDENLKKPWLVTSSEKNLDKVIHVNLGFAYAMKGRGKEAIDEYRKALENDPEDKDLHYNLAYLLSQENDFTGAITEYNKAIKGQASDKDVYYNIYLIYANDLKDQRAAEIYYKKYTELSSGQ